MASNENDGRRGRRPSPPWRPGGQPKFPRDGQSLWAPAMLRAAQGMEEGARGMREGAREMREAARNMAGAHND